MKTVLVTGAAGFIGSAIAAKLVKSGDKVVTIDNLSTGYKENIPEGVISLIGDDFDEDIIATLYDYHFDSIIHIAGQSSGEVSFENPIYDSKTNTQATLMLLDYARKTDCKEFIFASSMSVYGDHDNPPLVDEASETVPKSFYAVGKLASEQYMRIYSDVYGLKCTALRFFNVYGIGQNLENLKQGMASIFLSQAIKFKEITVKGSKDRFRDFVFIDDVVSSVTKSMNRESGALFEKYNVCTGKPIHVHEIVDLIKKTLPFDVSHKYIEGTLGDQMGIYGSFDKISKELNWKPTRDFEDGMTEMIQWALKEIG